MKIFDLVSKVAMQTDAKNNTKYKFTLDSNKSLRWDTTTKQYYVGHEKVDTKKANGPTWTCLFKDLFKKEIIDNLTTNQCYLEDEKSDEMDAIWIMADIWRYGFIGLLRTFYPFYNKHVSNRFAETIIDSSIGQWYVGKEYNAHIITGLDTLVDGLGTNWKTDRSIIHPLVHSLRLFDTVHSTA